MKRINSIYKARPDMVGNMEIFRSLPNRQTRAVGPIVFLDHMPEKYTPATTPKLPDGSFAHPHRGIATFSYLIKGELFHMDSYGNKGLVSDGGIQWMNAGNGIIHDEHFSVDFQKRGGLMHGMQFWVNLPAKQKAEPPEYMAVQSDELPIIDLPEGNGKLKVLLGAFEGKASKIPTYSEQFIYHITMKANSSYAFPTTAGMEYGMYLATGNVEVNEEQIQDREFVSFDTDGSGITFKTTDNDIDILLFGGEPYTEPVMMQGPFVMNSAEGIAQAYNDYHYGKYGEINYEGYLNPLECSPV